MVGDFLPPQLVYQGKTTRCLPGVEFPEGWHITHSENHWSNEYTMKEYIAKIIIPYVNKKKSFHRIILPCSFLTTLRHSVHLLYFKSLMTTILMCALFPRTALIDCSPLTLVSIRQPKNFCEQSFKNGMLKKCINNSKRVGRKL